MRRHCLENIRIITSDRILDRHTLLLEEDRIAGICPGDHPAVRLAKEQGAAVHDGAGAYAAAGFIDMHSDQIEVMIQPRPTSVLDFDLALVEHEKQLVNQGVTTMYHSLSFLRNNGAALRDKAARRPEKMKELALLIRHIQEGGHLIRHRLHCRYDIRNLEGYRVLLDYLDEDFIHLLSFNDHTPGQGQYRDLIRYQENLRNYHPSLENIQISQMIAERIGAPSVDAEQLVAAAAAARLHGIPIASHDDDSEEKLEFVQSRLQAGISEFPVELEVARKAKERGMTTIAGAPNVLLGKSHSGNLSAVEAILDGSIDILCSDYCPPALLHAVFKLHREHGLPLWDALRLVTLNPACALGIHSDFGSIQEGKKADLILIRQTDARPVITKVFIDGCLVSELNYRRPAHA